MLPYRSSKLTRLFLALFFVALIGYAYYELRGFISGPRIEFPSEIIQSSEKYILVQGNAERIASLRMNGADIPVTEDGAFEQPFLLAPGLNRIVFDAADKYGRTTQEVLQIVYTPSPKDAPEAVATSTTPLPTSTPQVAPESP